MRLGTWTTIDCPTKYRSKALKFLQNEYAKIGGTVRRVMNPHDFGSYPSFEVDVPYDFDSDDFHMERELVDMGEVDTTELIEEYEEWIEKSNEIETRYFKEFEDWL